MLPTAVRKQLEDLKKLEKEVYGTPSEEEGAQPETSPVGQEEGAETPQEIGKLRAEAVPQQEPTPQESPAPQVQDEAKWEQKYRVLQGKYNAEVPRLQKEIAGLREQNRELAAKIELLETLIAKQTTTQPSESAPRQEETLEKLKEDFPEIYNAVMTLVERYIPARIEEKLKPVETRLNQSMLDAFYSKLTALVPDWTTINTDDGFLAWLNEKDRFTGVTRHEMLMQAFNRLDVTTVAEFFKAYKELSQHESQPQEKQESPTRNIAPPAGRPSTKGSTSQPAKKVFTTKEVREFYTRVALGKVKPEDKKRIEKEIMLAYQEGRIVS